MTAKQQALRDIYHDMIDNRDLLSFYKESQLRIPSEIRLDIQEIGSVGKRNYAKTILNNKL